MATDDHAGEPIAAPCWRGGERTGPARRADPDWEFATEHRINGRLLAPGTESPSPEIAAVSASGARSLDRTVDGVAAHLGQRRRRTAADAKAWPTWLGKEEKKL